eukprot:gene11467-biopygen816
MTHKSARPNGELSDNGIQARADSRYASEDRGLGYAWMVAELDSVLLDTLHRCEVPFGVAAEEVPPTGGGGAAGEAAAMEADPHASVAHGGRPRKDKGSKG